MSTEIRMPVMNGIAATRKLTRLAARAGVLILTTYDRGSRCERSPQQRRDRRCRHQGNRYTKATIMPSSPWH
jgi:CheY-like chemotaxis protein